jgi:hypothetical protein
VDDFIGIDLDADRARRTAEREAKAAGSGDGLPIRLGGETVAVLPPEVAVDVFAPLRALDSDISLIIRQTMESAKGNSSAQATTDLVIDLLTQNPALPTTALDIVREAAERLVGAEAVAKFMEARPSAQDVAALLKGVFRFYGLTLGESSPSSDSSTDGQRTGESGGETSPGTSSTTSVSTSEASTPAPVAPALAGSSSSAPAGS